MLDLTDWQNKKYTTREGKPVRILCIDRAGSDYKIVGLLERGSRESIETWAINGRYILEGCSNLYEHDLINAKTKREGWVNVYGTFGCVTAVGDAWPTKEAAYRQSGSNRVDCVRIEWEE